MGNGVIFDCEDYTVFLLPCADGCQGILPNLGNQFGQFLLNGQVDHPHSGEANGHPDVTSGADSVVNLNMLRCEMVQLLIKGVGHKFCKNCGMPFIPAGSADSLYCNRIMPRWTRPCKDRALQQDRSRPGSEEGQHESSAQDLPPGAPAHEQAYGAGI